MQTPAVWSCLWHLRWLVQRWWLSTETHLSLTFHPIVRDRHDRCDRQPRAQKVLTTRIPRSLLHNNNGIQKYQAIIYCYHIQTFSACLVRWKECAESTTRILLLGCIESDRRKSSARQDDLQYRNISVKLTLTVKDSYVQKSFALGDLRR
jgi:hypothetical protein